MEEGTGRFGKKKVAIISFLLGALFAVMGIILAAIFIPTLRVTRSPTTSPPKQNMAARPVNMETKEAEFFLLGQTYRIDIFGEGCADFYLEDSENKDCDQRIVLMSWNNDSLRFEDHVVLPSIKSLFPELRENSNTLLVVFTSTDHDSVTLASVLWGTSGGIGQLYKFTLGPEGGSLIAMRVNDAFAKCEGYHKLSPNQQYLVCPSRSEEDGKSQIMYLIDLENDSSRSFVTLSGNETLNAGGAYLSGYFEIEWMNDFSLIYAVYDQQKKGFYINDVDEVKTLLIGYRRAVI